jgi:amidohydrolase family protein
MSGVSRLAITGGRVLVGGPSGFGPEGGGRATVLIEGDRITRVDEAPAPADARVLRADGLTVLPGMIDVHTHVPSPAAMALFVRHGLTSVRFAGTPPGVVAALRQRVNAGELPGPRIFSCGPILDEPPSAWPSVSQELAEPSVAAAVVKRLADAEADALLVGQRVTLRTLKAVVDAAHERGLPVTGQTWTTSVREAIQLGLDGVENTARIPEDPTLPPDWVESYTSIGHRLGRLVHLWATAPPEPIDDVVSLMADAGTDWAPELVSFAHWAGLTDAAMAALPGWSMLSAEEQVALPGSRAVMSEGWTDSERAATREALARLQTAVSSFVQQGGHLAVGTDAHPGGLFYHLELDFYRQAGLSNADVLRAATAGGGRALHREAELGSLEVGKLADLIVVDGDPRTDLTALQRVRCAVVGGRIVVADDDCRVTLSTT